MPPQLAPNNNNRRPSGGVFYVFITGLYTFSCVSAPQAEIFTFSGNPKIRFLKVYLTKKKHKFSSAALFIPFLLKGRNGCVLAGRTLKFRDSSRVHPYVFSSTVSYPSMHVKTSL